MQPEERADCTAASRLSASRSGCGGACEGVGVGQERHAEDRRGERGTELEPEERGRPSPQASRHAERDEHGVPNEQARADGLDDDRSPPPEATDRQLRERRADHTQAQQELSGPRRSRARLQSMAGGPSTSALRHRCAPTPSSSRSWRRPRPTSPVEEVSRGEDEPGQRHEAEEQEGEPASLGELVDHGGQDAGQGEDRDRDPRPPLTAPEPGEPDRDREEPDCADAGQLAENLAGARRGASTHRRIRDRSSPTGRGTALRNATSTP